MTTKFWTEELLASCTSALAKSDTITDAIEVLKGAGIKVTYSQMRHAFSRHDMGTPASYLGRDHAAQFVEDLAVDFEALTRPGNLGGVGSSQHVAQVHLEKRLGTPLDHIEEGLSDAIKDATRDLIDDRSRKRALALEAKSNHALQDRMIDLHQAMKRSLKFVKTNNSNINLTSIPDHVGIPPTTLVVPLADLHYGKTWTDRFGKVCYNRAILESRLKKILHNVTLEIHNSQPSQIIVWIAGDLFEAPLGNMRRAQAQKMEMFGSEVYVAARAGITSFVQEIQTVSTCPVTLLITAGNHDRLTEDKDFNSEDFMMFMFADSIAAHLPGVDVKALAPVANVIADDVEMILLHGHRNRLANENSCIQIVNNHGVTNNRKLVIQGHYHNMKWLSGKKWDCVTLPSICGNDDFSQYDINKYAEAKHCMFKISNGNAAMLGPFLL